MDVGHGTGEGDPLFHYDVRQVDAPGPMARHGFGMEGGRGGFQIEKPGCAAFEVAALHRIPAPRLLAPKCAVLVAVIGLLDESAVVEVVEEIAVRAAG